MSVSIPGSSYDLEISYLFAFKEFVFIFLFASGWHRYAVSLSAVHHKSEVSHRSLPVFSASAPLIGLDAFCNHFYRPLGWSSIFENVCRVFLSLSLWSLIESSM
jgi:hypothetical protein